MTSNKCALCGFSRGVQRHHIIKRLEDGSDEEENIVLLCPNHHWIADFGSEEEITFILKQIKETTGKVGKFLHPDKIKLLDERAYALDRWRLCRKEGLQPYRSLEKFKDDFAYGQIRKLLRPRSPTPRSDFYNEKADKLRILFKIADSIQEEF